ncbi:hypothetical protein GCM10010407_19070 [Rarobacter incanus]
MAKCIRQRGIFSVWSALGLLETPELWNESGFIPRRKSIGRCYSAEEKATAVWMVRTLRAEIGTSQGTTTRVAEQLGYGVESVRSWVRQARYR